MAEQNQRPLGRRRGRRAGTVRALAMVAWATSIAAASDTIDIREDQFDLTVSAVLEGRVDQIAAKTRDRFARLAERFDRPEWSRRPRLRCFASHEERGLTERSVASYQVDPDQALGSFVLEDGVSRQCGRTEALLFLCDRFGPPAARWLAEGAPYALADEDAVKDYRALAAWVHLADETTPLADLLNPERYDERSVLIQAPLAAVVVDVLLSRFGVDAFRDAWRGDTLDLTALQPAYHEALDDLVARHRHWIDERRQRRRAHAANTRMHGFCFAHEGYRVYNGYVSAMAGRSLARAAELGANAVSLTPFGGYRAPDAPEVRWSRRTGSRAGGETDEAILVSARHAHERGMTVMLKPHLWGHGWCGEIAMKNDEDWRRWFHAYGEWLVHNALLAERGDMEWLSIGCELARTTPEHAAEWRSLAERAGRLFAGGLTYSANWGEEMERLEFTDALDAVGVDFYFPLSDREAPDDAELNRAAEEAIGRVAALSSRYQRPILLTEVGYPVRARPWHEPYRGGSEPGHDIDQARCFRALDRALRRQTAIDGVFVWKWPTLDNWSETERADYWPAGPECLAALRALFRE